MRGQILSEETTTKEQTLIGELREEARLVQISKIPVSPSAFSAFLLRAADTLADLEADRDMWRRTCLHYQSLLGERGLL